MDVKIDVEVVYIPLYRGKFILMTANIYTYTMHACMYIQLWFEAEVKFVDPNFVSSDASPVDLHFDIQSTGQKSHCVSTAFQPLQCSVLIKQSGSIRFRRRLLRHSI